MTATSDGLLVGIDNADLAQAAPERYRPLFEPLALGPVRAPNRFLAVPYATGWSMDQMNVEIGHRAMRAEGGWGIVSTGECAVAPEGTAGRLASLDLFSDEDVEDLSRLTEAIHAHGSLAAVELVHYGGLATPTVFRGAPVGASQIQTGAMFFSTGLASNMTVADIRRNQDQWVDAAKRARSAGFDMVYVHCAHSGQPMQFLTPYYNRRTDEFGGSLENRARFLLELLERIRAEVGDDLAVACRFAIVSLGNTGVEIDEALATMRMADHLVDLWDLTIGALDNAHYDLTPSRLFEEGNSLQWTKRAKEATVKPVAGTGRFTDPDLMVRLLADATLDLIGGARPGIADPFLPRKIAAGEFGRVRECIGSNRCAYSQMQGSMVCSQNATTGEEFRRGWHPERFAPAANREAPVLVVGAGPAGLECATVLARRGFEMVHVVDAARQPGGHLRWFTKLPGFNPWGRVIEHRQWLVDHTQAIQFVPGKTLDADAILDYGAAIVVVATGSRWQTLASNPFDGSPIPGADASLDHVLTPEQILLDGKPVPGRRVLVYDCQGDAIPLGVAQHLQARGHEVEVVSPFTDIGSRAMQDGVGPALMGEVAAAGGELRPGHTLAAVTGTGAVFFDMMMQEVEVPCDAIVLLTTRRSDDALYMDLNDRPEDRATAAVDALYRIGDCVAPQNFSEAIFSGHRLAREIDAADPERPVVPRRR